MSDFNFFGDDSPYLQHPLLTPERTAGEIDFLVQRMALSPGARLVDVGCGFGRHTVELAKRGFLVTGVDASATMIDAAREQAADAGVAADLRQVRAEDFGPDILFDAAICLFTTLGQVTAAGVSGSALLAGVRSALAAGAPFAVEVPQRAPAVRQLKKSETFGHGEYYSTVSRHFDPETKLIAEQFIVVSAEKQRTFNLQVRVYSEDELATMLSQAGFVTRERLGGYSGKPLQENDLTMLFIAEAR